MEPPPVILSETVDSTPVYIPGIKSRFTEPMVGHTCPNADDWDDTFELFEPFGETHMEPTARQMQQLKAFSIC
ncbi:hypothetical protein Lser_V15G26196 [Lactuca serriola]